jgi:hypothetical protein
MSGIIQRKYYPDFYLPEFNLWIEVKGWEKEIDQFKWAQFPHTLKIIRNNDLLLYENDINQLQIQLKLC